MGLYHSAKFGYDRCRIQGIRIQIRLIGSDIPKTCGVPSLVVSIVAGVFIISAARNTATKPYSRVNDRRYLSGKQMCLMRLQPYTGKGRTGVD